MGWPTDHVATGLARWVQEAAGLATSQVVLEQANRGNRPSGPFLSLQRIGVRWVGSPADRLADGAPSWTLDFAGFDPGDYVGASVFGAPLVILTDLGDSPIDARDAWQAALTDLRLDEVIEVTPADPALLTVALTTDAARGFLNVAALIGVDVTATASPGPSEVVEQSAVLTMRVWANNYPDVLAAEAVLARVRAQAARPVWIDKSRLYLCGATGVIGGASAVGSTAIMIGAEYEARAWLDLRIALVVRGPAEDADALAEVADADGDPTGYIVP